MKATSDQSLCRPNAPRRIVIQKKCEGEKEEERRKTRVQISTHRLKRLLPFSDPFSPHVFTPDYTVVFSAVSAFHDTVECVVTIMRGSQ